MKKQLQISNGIALVATLVINYLSNTGIFNGNTMASVSAEYQNLFTPAGYAFSIWGLIYLGLLGFVIYYGRSLFITVKTEDNTLKQVGWWFVISCLANIFWIILWLYNHTFVSVIMMIILLVSLLKIVINTQMELHSVPVKKFIFLWWPFCLYSGWVAVALIANISAFLKKIAWNGFGISEVAWAVFMIFTAAAVNIFMIWNRNMREFALVGVWALVAIAVANQAKSEIVFWTAIITAILVFFNIAIHGFQNRKNNVFFKKLLP